MKKLHLISLVMGGILMTSCAGMHNFTSVPLANPAIPQISQNNFHVVKTVSASTSCTYVFGIGGLSKKAMINNAVSDMITKANLKGSQVVGNIVTKVSNKLVLPPIYYRKTITVQGTVFEYDSPNIVHVAKVAEAQHCPVQSKVAATETNDEPAEATAPQDEAGTPAAAEPQDETKAPVEAKEAESTVTNNASNEIASIPYKERKDYFSNIIDGYYEDMNLCDTIDGLYALNTEACSYTGYKNLMSKSTVKDFEKLSDEISDKTHKLEKAKKAAEKKAARAAAKEATK